MVRIMPSGAGHSGNAGAGRRRGGLARTRLLPLAARLCALAGLAVLGQFVLGRVLTDSQHWSQYLWWVPAIWSLLAAWVCWGVSALAGRLSLRTGGLMLRPFVLIGCVGATLWVLFGEWHLHRAVLRPDRAPREQTLRVLHWNHSSQPDIRGSAELIRDADADIAVVVNSRNGDTRREIVRAMFESLAPASEDTVRVLPNITGERQPGHVFGDWRVIVGSRERILRTGVVTLARVDDGASDWATGSDAGVVVWCEIEAGGRFAALGRPLVLWVVDLPSDPGLSRVSVMASARRAVDAWRQPAQETTKGGWWRPVGDPVSVPEPDIVIGDFNTPRGSASLDTLAPGMRDAFEEAGWGRARSWRQVREAGPNTPGGPAVGRAVSRVMRVLLPLADWHIDLTLLGERWRATRYRLVRPETGAHDVQVVDLEARD